MASFNPYYTREELEAMEFKSLGENVCIDRRTPIDRPYKISIGNNVRIGSFCILSGDISIGNYVHIASFSFLSGGAGIILKDFIAISHNVHLFTGSDDYSGEFMSCPLVDEKYQNVDEGEIIVGNHSIIGCSSVIMPNVKLADGTALGAMSLLKNSTKEFGIYAGIPAKKIKDRKRNLLELEKEFLLKRSKNE